MFKTNADIVNGEYGIHEYNHNTGKYKFKPLGKAVIIESITRDIETDEVKLRLTWDYLGEPVHFEIPSKALSEPALLQALINAGADVTKKNFNVFIDTLRLQELDIENSGFGSEKVYTHLGWKSIPVPTTAGGTVNKICYRAHTLIGLCSAKYNGPLKVTPMGTFEAWKTMIEDEIIGNPPAEVIMLASLSAVVNGLIATYTTGENSIVHISGLSGTGKSAIAMAGASCYGEPFDGERRVYDANGMPSSQLSVYGSWSATENAMLGRCMGNRGCLIVLNELGKYKGSDMSTIIYNLSEGTDKLRMTKDLNVRQSEGFCTVILSVGEHSLLDRCQNKADGLRVRVLELDMPITTSAENADRIKSMARKNNGWAAPMLAEHIINNGGIKMVLDIYDRQRSELLAIWPETPSHERFVSKFPALFLTTAELAKTALGITFSSEAIVDFFLELETLNGSSRNSAQDSYEMLMSQCLINAHKFYVKNTGSYSGTKGYQEQCSIPVGECWGRITNTIQPFPGNRVVVQEIEIDKDIVEQLLQARGFSNKKTCIEAWKAADVLDFEDATHPCRKRKINPNAPNGTNDKVYVFRRFCAPEDVDGHLEALKKREEQQKKLKSKILSMKNREKLLEEGGDDEDDNNAHSA